MNRSFKIFLCVILILWVGLAIIFPLAYFQDRIKLFMDIAVFFSFLNLFTSLFAAYIIFKEIHDSNTEIQEEIPPGEMYLNEAEIEHLRWICRRLEDHYAEDTTLRHIGYFKEIILKTMTNKYLEWDELEHLAWMYERIKVKHNENPSLDFMREFKRIIDKLTDRAAL